MLTRNSSLSWGRGPTTFRFLSSSHSSWTSSGRPWQSWSQRVGILTRPGTYGCFACSAASSESRLGLTRQSKAHSGGREGVGRGAMHFQGSPEDWYASAEFVHSTSFTCGRSCPTPSAVGRGLSVVVERRDH